MSGIMVVSHHSTLLTYRDRAYRVECYYREDNNVVQTEMRVNSQKPSLLPSDPMPLPSCQYKVEMAGNSSSVDVSPAFVTIGDSVVHVWTCGDAVHAHIYCMQLRLLKENLVHAKQQWALFIAETEIDVVALSPAPSQNSYSSSQNEKKYFCQRCLNHDLQFPRKGHKPVCKYANCTCSDCIMVEQRRQLNNMLSKSKLAESPRETVNGRRVRDPQCARCRQHGFRVPLRGHKRVLCQFSTCKCEMCELVEDRRSLMAKQIKLRRDQQRQRNSIDGRHSSDSTGDHELTEPSSAEVSPSPLIELPHPVAMYPCTPAPITPPQMTPLPMVLPPPQILPAVPSPFFLPLPLFQIFTQLTQQPH